MDENELDAPSGVQAYIEKVVSDLSRAVGTSEAVSTLPPEKSKPRSGGAQIAVSWLKPPTFAFFTCCTALGDLKSRRERPLGDGEQSSGSSRGPSGSFWAPPDMSSLRRQCPGPGSRLVAKQGIVTAQWPENSRGPASTVVTRPWKGSGTPLLPWTPLDAA